MDPIPSSGCGGRRTRENSLTRGSDDDEESSLVIKPHGDHHGSYQSFRHHGDDVEGEGLGLGEGAGEGEGEGEGVAPNGLLVGDPAQFLRGTEETVRVADHARIRRQLMWCRSAVILTIVAISCVMLASTVSKGSKLSSGEEAEDPFQDTLMQSSWKLMGTKPNIIFLLADDLGYNSMQYSATTDLTVSTPFLSKMAQQGIILTNYYAQESCTPSRAALLTGRYPLTLGMQFNDVSTASGWGLNDTEILIPQILREEGYITYMLGKWNLGHFSPKFLPTARGFDYFLGFLTGETYYWSKLCPQHTGIADLLYADENCYHGYDGDDKHEYSTFLYRDKAVKVIRNHDYSAPLFMYLSFQGVHDPYHDHNIYSNGIPKEYLTDDVYTTIHTTVMGRERRQLAMALSIMDDAVKKIFKAVKQMGQSGNTIFIWASDNGGCVLTGGRNGDLRGSKGTLFEGGTKVEAFIYSPLVNETARGSQYSSMFHVSDWLPTILGMADIDYTPEAGHELDGVSHASNLMVKNPVEVRSTMLYNFYTNIEGQFHDGQMWNMWTDAPLAIRDSQYKLIHTYDDNNYSGWYSQDSKDEDDDSLVNAATCSQTDTLTGNYSFFLFDLLNDPYESVNLYDNSSYDDIKSVFYNSLIMLAKSSRLDITTFMETAAATKVWVEHMDTIVPWAELDDSIDQFYPRYCRSTTIVSPSDNDDYSDEGWANESDDVSLIGDDDDDWTFYRNDDLIDTTPTFKPTRKPTSLPSFAPDYTPSPSGEPTLAPSGPTYEPTGMAPQSLPTIKPTATKFTSPPTNSVISPPVFSSKTGKPTMEPTITIVTPTVEPSSAGDMPTSRPVLIFSPTPSVTTALPTPVAFTTPPTPAPPTPIPLTEAPTPSPPTPIPLAEPPTPELTMPPSPAAIPLTEPPSINQLTANVPTPVPIAAVPSSPIVTSIPTRTSQSSTAAVSDAPSPGFPTLIPSPGTSFMLPSLGITSSPSFSTQDVDSESRSPTVALQATQKPTLAPSSQVGSLDEEIVEEKDHQVVVANYSKDEEDDAAEDEEEDVDGVVTKRTARPSPSPTSLDNVTEKTPRPSSKPSSLDNLVLRTKKTTVLPTSNGKSKDKKREIDRD